MVTGNNGMEYGFSEQWNGVWLLCLAHLYKSLGGLILVAEASSGTLYQKEGHLKSFEERVLLLI